MKRGKTIILILLLFLIFSISFVAWIVASVNLDDYTQRHAFEPHKENLILITHALKQYYNDYGVYPEELENLTPTYLGSIPKYSKGNESKNYSYHISYVNETQYVLTFNVFENHLIYQKIRYCDYFSDEPEEFSCSLDSENVDINFSEINYTRFD